MEAKAIHTQYGNPLQTTEEQLRTGQPQLVIMLKLTNTETRA